MGGTWLSINLRSVKSQINIEFFFPRTDATNFVLEHTLNSHLDLTLTDNHRSLRSAARLRQEEKLRPATWTQALQLFKKISPFRIPVQIPNLSEDTVIRFRHWGLSEFRRFHEFQTNRPWSFLGDTWNLNFVARFGKAGIQGGPGGGPGGHQFFCFVALFHVFFSRVVPCCSQYGCFQK